MSYLLFILWSETVWSYWHDKRITGRDPFNQNSDRSDREKRTTSKGGPVFSKLFRLDRTDPLSFGPKFPEILVEWIAPTDSLICEMSQHSKISHVIVPIWLVQMRNDLTHLIALTIDRSDWIISEISRGKRPYSPVPFLNGELFIKSKNDHAY